MKVPATTFSSQGQQTIPEQYANQIPSIAFTVPHLDGQVKLQINKADSNESIACIQSSITNGKTLDTPVVKYVGVGVAGAALIMSAVSATLAGAHPGASSPSPTFGETFGWFQAMAMNGMMSVDYPQVYQSFATNFGFSTGLVSWGAMQTTIDNFRAATGGNLTHDNYAYLQNATLVFPSDANSTSSGLRRRAFDALILFARDGATVDVNGTSSTVGSGSTASSSNSTAPSQNQHAVRNLQAYVEQLMIPQANTFMTLLLIFTTVVAALIVLVLLAKLVLEAWSLMRPLPHSVDSWRRRYWWRLAKAITNLVVLLYSVWTMYCIYQFTNGDSWAAKLLAGITLALFTALLAGFIFKIWQKARYYKKLEGDSSKLYEDKETWIRYSLFYDSFRKSYWWLFIPLIVYAFARGAIIAAANGHGLIQTAGELFVDAVMLIVLLWTRPYQLKSGNIINIIIQVVRVLSVACILVFVEELNINQTTKTIIGLALIVLQCVLTGLLAILILVNSLMFCFRQNPHRRMRKDAEKLARYPHPYPDDRPAASDAPDSLLLHPMADHDHSYKPQSFATARFGDQRGAYEPVPPVDSHRGGLSDVGYHARHGSGDALVPSAAGMGVMDDGSRSRSRSRSLSFDRQPTLPRLDVDRAM